MGNRLQNKIGGTMKTILYSIYTKIILLIICMISILSVVSTSLDALKRWNEYETIVYMKEDYFKDSQYLKQQLNDAMDHLEYVIAYEVEVSNYGKDTATEDMSQYLHNNIENDKYEYSLQIDGKQYTNMELSNQKHEFFFNINIDKEGRVTSNRADDIDSYFVHGDSVKQHDIEIYVALSLDYVNDCKMLWTHQKDFIQTIYQQWINSLNIFFISIIALMILTGKDKKGNVKEYGIDKRFVEFNIGVLGIILYTLFLFAKEIVYQYLYENLLFDILKGTILGMVGIGLFLTIVVGLSLVRIIKHKKLLERSFIYFIICKFI